jgi:hypothetical protein
MEHQKDRDNSASRANASLGIWMAIGIAIGVSIGAMMDNVAIGVAIGVIFGISFYMIVKGRGTAPREPDATPEHD